MLPPPFLFAFLLTLAQTLPLPIPAPDLASLLSQVSNPITRALPIGAIPSSLAAPIPTLSATSTEIKGTSNPKIIPSPKKKNPKRTFSKVAERV